MNSEDKAFVEECVAKLMPPASAPVGTTTAVATQEVELGKFGLGGGILNKLPDIKVMGLPVGDALKGAVVAGVGDAISGLRDVVDKDHKIPGWAIPAGVALALNLKPVKGFLGERAVQMGQFLLIYEALQGAVDVRGKVRDMLSRFIPQGAGGGGGMGALGRRREGSGRPPGMDEPIPPPPPWKDVPSRPHPALGPGQGVTRSMGTGDRYARAF